MNQQELSKFTTRARDLTTAQLDRKGKYLFTYAKMEMRKVMFSPACSFVGCAWLVNTKANGDIFTCEQLSFSFQDGQGCQRYLLSQRDITRQVPVSHLLAIAGSGDYVKEVQARRQEASRRLSSDYLKAHVLPRLCTAAEKLGALSPSALTSATLGELPGMDLREVGCPKACLLPGLRAREKVIPASPTATLEDLPMFNLNEAVGFPEAGTAPAFGARPADAERASSQLAHALRCLSAHAQDMTQLSVVAPVRDAGRCCAQTLFKPG